MFKSKFSNTDATSQDKTPCKLFGRIQVSNRRRVRRAGDPYAQKTVVDGHPGLTKRNVSDWSLKRRGLFSSRRVAIQSLCGSSLSERFSRLESRIIKIGFLLSFIFGEIA